MERIFSIKYACMMDKKVLPLCDALNSIKGIETIESCCGHGKSSFDIWFTLNKKYFQNLHIVARIICIRYGGFSNWNCNAYCNDTYKKDKLEFELSSGNIRGEEAYKQAKTMAENIYEHLNHENYKKGFAIIK